MEFTAGQLAAVSPANLGTDTCVVAGPGSGKTTLLVEYFRRLVEAGVDPLRILAITFTEKAAANMREKLAAAFPDAVMRGRLERAWVSTVHGFCARLLRENAIFAGIDPEFSISDERQAGMWQREIAADTLDALFAERPAEVRALIGGLACYDLCGAILGVYDAMRGAGVRVEDLRAYRIEGQPREEELDRRLAEIRAEGTAGWSPDQLIGLYAALSSCERIRAGRLLEAFECRLTALRRGNRLYEMVRGLKHLVPEVQRGYLTACYESQRRLLIEILTRFDAVYRERKRQSGALDYGDLEEAAVGLLAGDAGVRARVQAQFDQVLMDEFQDTNGQQARLLELLRPPGRFYAVGDINQSIYGFRHAEPGVFREYRDRVACDGGNLVELVENFRSRAEVLRAVEAIVGRAPGIEHRPLVAARDFPEKAAPSVELVAAAAADAGEAQQIEARWVARRIVELVGKLPVKGRPACFQDVAVLVRNSEVLDGFTDAFDRAGIPYLVSRGRGFYESREVMDLMHLLRVLANPRDEISMAAVLRSPFVEVSDGALLRLKQAGNLGAAVCDLGEPDAFEPEDREKLRRFREQLARWRDISIGFDRALLRAIDETGYPHDTGPRGGANVEKFLAQAREASTRLSLAGFVEELERLRAANLREPEAPPEDSANAVKVMTVHAAKGLEFPIVFLAALHKGFDQSLGGLSFSPRVGLGARCRNPATGEEKDDLYQHAIRQERKVREEDESSRLFYVAMTRAEEHLVLSLAGNRNWAGVLAENLHIDLETPRDEIVDFATWRMRVLCVNAPPATVIRAEAASGAQAVPCLARPAVTGQYDSNATVTAITAFAACPRRYYLQHYLGWDTAAPPGEAGGGLSASELGREVHALLAGQRVPWPHREALALAARFPASELGRRAARAARVEREFDFLMAVDDVVLRGQIDLWFEEGGELVLVDYKTDRETWRAASYAPQIRLYAMALERLTGRLPARAYLYFLRPGRAVPVTLTPASLAEAAETVREFRRAQDEMRFPLHEGAHCYACPYFQGLCPSGMADVIHAAAIHSEDLGGDEPGIG